MYSNGSLAIYKFHAVKLCICIEIIWFSSALAIATPPASHIHIYIWITCAFYEVTKATVTTTPSPLIMSALQSNPCHEPYVRIETRQAQSSFSDTKTINFRGLPTSLKIMECHSRPWGSEMSRNGRSITLTRAKWHTSTQVHLSKHQHHVIVTTN